MKLPKFSAKLSTDVRYAEGYVMWGINLAMLVGALIPADGLSTKTAAIIASINTILHLLSARAVQITALIQGLGIGAPEVPKVLAAAEPETEKFARTVVPQAVADVEKPSAEEILTQAVTDEQEFLTPPPADPEDEPTAGTPVPVAVAPAPAPEPTPAPAPAAAT